MRSTALSSGESGLGRIKYDMNIDVKESDKIELGSRSRRRMRVPTSLETTTFPRIRDAARAAEIDFSHNSDRCR